jgi:hypothetical protein
MTLGFNVLLLTKTLSGLSKEEVEEEKEANEKNTFLCILWWVSLGDRNTVQLNGGWGVCTSLPNVI